MESLALVLCLAATLPAVALASSEPTAVDTEYALNNTAIVSSELTRIVRSAQPILNLSSTELAHNFAMNAAAASAGFYIGGPNTQDLVLIFFFKNAKELGQNLAAQERSMRGADGAAPLGSVAGYPLAASGTLRSLVWDQASTSAASTYVAITIPGPINSRNGSIGGSVVEGVAIETGSMPPPQSTAIALARWGATHLARVLAKAQ